VDLVVLATVGGGADAAGDSVARLPVDGEVGAGAVAEVAALLGVLGEAGLFVDADGLALGALVILGIEVFGVSGAENAVSVSRISD
jgi:hypothetical protein